MIRRNKRKEYYEKIYLVNKQTSALIKRINEIIEV